MVRFPVVDSALEGFRVTREQPLSVAAWAGWLFVGGLAGDALLTAPGMGELGRLARAAPGALTPVEITAFGRALAGAWPAVLAFLAVSYGVGVVFYTAVLRAVFEPTARGRSYFMRVGRDEARQLALALAVLVLLFAVSLLVAAALDGVMGLGQALGPIAGPPLAAFGVAAVVGALAYPLLRLSLAPPATFAARKFRLVDTWAMTRGFALPLLGVYALALLLSAVVYFLATVIVAALTLSIAAALGGGMESVRAMTQPDVSSLAALFSAPSLLAVALGAAVSAPVYVVTAAAGAAAYRSLAAGRLAPARA